MLEIGSEAPDFSLTEANGEKLSLSGFRGQKVLLWFFPKASTPG